MQDILMLLPLVGAMMTVKDSVNATTEAFGLLPLVGAMMTPDRAVQ